MRGEQRCGAMLHLIARSWKRRLALSYSRFSHPCPQGGQKNLCRAETRAVLSWDVSLHFICFCNMFHIYGISSTAGQKCLKILNLHFYNTALVIFPHLQKNRFLFKELYQTAWSNSKCSSVQVELPSWQFSDKWNMCL